MNRVESLADLPGAGYVRIPRAILSEPWARRPNCLALFVYLIANANREGKDWNGIKIERGQLVTSRARLVAGTGISEKSIRNALQELEKAERAKQRAYPGAKPFRTQGAKQGAKSFTLITICDIDSYMAPSKAEGQAEGQAEKKSGAKKGAKKGATTEDIYIYLFNIELDPEFRSILTDWVNYKAENGHPFKGKASITAARNRLRRISDNNPDKARAIIDNAIASGWQGFFPISEATAHGRPSKDNRFLDPTDVFEANY